MKMRSGYFMAVFLPAIISTTVVRAQRDDLMNLSGIVGNYFGKEGPPNMLNNGEVDGASLHSMRARLLEITLLLENCPDFRQPRGFDLRIQLSVNKAAAGEPSSAFTGDAWLAIHEFIRNGDGKIETNAETGAGVQARVNQLARLFPDKSGGECDEFELPRFFYKIPVKEQGGNFLELEDGTRLVTNGKPLCVPYTKEQYLQFLIRKKEKTKTDQQATLQQFKDMKEKMALQGIDENIRKVEAMIAATDSSLSRLRRQLKDMTATDRQKQAFLYFNADATIGPDAGKDAAGQARDAGRFLELTAEGDPHGQALFTVNTAYFNPMLPKTSIQLITLSRDMDDRFVDSRFGQLLNRVMEAVDYGLLKKMIQR
jgi:hypothetical protein